MRIRVCVTRIEVHMLSYFWSRSILQHQFLIGTLIFSTGMFEIAITYGKKVPNRISELGADHSFFVYIFHPYALGLCSFIFRTMHISALLKDSILLPSTFVCTLFSSIFLLKVSPVVHRLLSGTFFYIKPPPKTCPSR